MKRLNKTVILFSLLMLVVALTGCATNKPAVEEDKVVQTIEDIDKNRGDYLPVEIEKLHVTSDGEAVLETTGDLNVLVGDNYVAAMGVKQAYIFGFGSKGYRSVIFLLEDGTVSALKAKVLAEKHDARLKNRLGDYKDITAVEAEGSGEDTIIYAIDSSGGKRELNEFLE